MCDSLYLFSSFLQEILKIPSLSWLIRSFPDNCDIFKCSRQLEKSSNYVIAESTNGFYISKGGRRTINIISLSCDFGWLQLLKNSRITQGDNTNIHNEFKANRQEPLNFHPWMVRCYCRCDLHAIVISYGESQDENANVKYELHYPKGKHLIKILK